MGACERKHGTNHGFEKQNATASAGGATDPATPGPGAYSVAATCPSGPAITIGTRLPEPGSSSTAPDDGRGCSSSPGPGEYEPEGLVGHSRGTEGPAWTIGAKLEGREGRSDSPGKLLVLIGQHMVFTEVAGYGGDASRVLVPPCPASTQWQQAKCHEQKCWCGVLGPAITSAACSDAREDIGTLCAFCFPAEGNYSWQYCHCRDSSIIV